MLHLVLLQATLTCMQCAMMCHNYGISSSSHFRLKSRAMSSAKPVIGSIQGCRQRIMCHISNIGMASCQGHNISHAQGHKFQQKPCLPKESRQNSNRLNCSQFAVFYYLQRCAMSSPGPRPTPSWYACSSSMISNMYSHVCIRCFDAHRHSSVCAVSRVLKRRCPQTREPGAGFQRRYHTRSHEELSRVDRG